MNNIKTKIFLLLTATGSLFLTSCASTDEELKPKSVEGQCIIAGESAPTWACGSYSKDDSYYAVGSAPISKLGHNFSRTEAVANGRANLAQQIKLKVKSKVESYMRSSGIKDNELVEKVVTQVSRQVADLTLEGSKQVSYWENKGDNSIYVLMSVAKGTTNEYIDKEVETNLNIVEVQLQQVNSNKALKSL